MHEYILRALPRQHAHMFNMRPLHYKQRPRAVMSQKAEHGYVETAARLHTPHITAITDFFIYNKKAAEVLPSSQL